MGSSTFLRPFSRWLSDSDVVQESPFMQRRWQSQVLLLSNFIFSLVGLCILAAWEYGYSYRLRKSRAIFYSAFSVGLMAFSWFVLWKKALDRQAFAVAGEMLTAFHIAVMFTFFGQGLSTFSLWSLLTVCFIFFLRLRAHPLSVFFFCLECLCGLHHEVGEALMKWPAVYRDGTWEEIRGHEVFTSEWKVKVAVLSAWLIVVTLWYDNSFCEKLAAVKQGLILNGSIDVSLLDLTEATLEAGSQNNDCPRRFRFWWHCSTDPTFMQAPVMAKSIPWAWLSVLAVWLGPWVSFDLLVRASFKSSWFCQSSGYPYFDFWFQYFPAVMFVCCVLTALLGHALVKKKKVTPLLGQDLPLTLSTCMPSILMTYSLHWIIVDWCVAFKPYVAIDQDLAHLYANLRSLAIFSCFLASSTLTMASVHPSMALLAFIAFGFVFSFGRVRPGVWTPEELLFLPILLLHLAVYYIDVKHFLRHLWANSQQTNQTLAEQSSSGMELSMQNLEALSILQPLRNESSIGYLVGGDPNLLQRFHKFREIQTPMDLIEVRSASSSTMMSQRQRTVSSTLTSSFPEEPSSGVFRPAVALVRHGEREDAVWNSAWFESEDGSKHPYDCPITSEGVRQAREVADLFMSFSNFGIVVSSPYLRCVQTAVIIADRLGLMVLLDHELGEVFGRSVFSDMGQFRTGQVPWRQRRQLYESMKLWRPEEWSNSKPPVQLVCWRRILGKAPSAGESLSEGRKRYARRFMTYLARSRHAEKNLVVVSHGHMMEACLKVLPSTSSHRVSSVPYCGGFMAQLYPNGPASQVTDDEPLEVKVDSDSFMDGEVKDSKELDTPEKQVRSAQLAWWDVKLFGLDLRPASSASDQSRKKFLTQLQVGSLTWEDIQRLLGELPDSQKSWDFLDPNGTNQRRRRSRVNSDCTTRTENTDASMYLFKRPNYAGSDVFSEPKMDDPIPPALVPPSATPSTIVLNSNPLLNRRQKMAEPLGEVTETSDSALASSAEASVTPIALKNKALLSQEEGIADDAVTPARPETNGAARSLQNSSLLSRRRTYAGGDQSTTGRAMETSDSAPAPSVEAGVNPIALKSNSLLSRRQKLAEANQSREEGFADDTATEVVEVADDLPASTE